MKRIIMFVLLFAALKVAGQTTGYLRFDTVKIMKQNGTCELYVINKTKDSLGLLTNVGGGLTQFIKPKVLNDSAIVVGLDTLIIRGTGSGSGSATLSNVGAGYRRVKTADGQVKTEFAGYGINKDSTTNTDAITDRVDTTTLKAVYLPLHLNAQKTIDQAGNNIYFTGGGEHKSDSLKLSILTGPPVVTSLINLGHSIAYGQGASVDDSTYKTKASRYYGLSLSDFSVSASGIWRAASNFYLNVDPGHTNLTMVMAGLNDVRRNAWATATKNKLRNGYTAIIANQYLATWVTAGDASVTKVGTWGAGYTASAVGGKGVNDGIYSTTLNDTAKWTFSGTSVVVGLMGADGAGGASYEYAKGKIYIDGVLMQSFDETGQWDGVTDGVNDNKRGTFPLIFTGLSAGSHTIEVVQNESGRYLVIDYFGTLVAPSAGKPLILIHDPYLTSGGYATSPNLANDDLIDSLNTLIDEIYTVYSGLGYPVYRAETNNFYSTSTGTGGDGIHPNDVGYEQIFQAIKNSASGFGIPASPGTFYFTNNDKIYVGLAGSPPKSLAYDNDTTTYILNRTTSAQTAGFKINGTGTVGTIVAPTATLGNISSAAASGTLLNFTPVASQTMVAASGTITGSVITNNTNVSASTGLLWVQRNISSASGAYSTLALATQGGGDSTGSPQLTFRNDGISREYVMGYDISTHMFEINWGNQNQLGGRRLFATDSLGVIRLRTPPGGAVTDSVMVYRPSDNTVRMVDPGTLGGGADGNGIYGGNGTLPSDVTVTGANNSITFNDIFAHRINSDYNVIAKANGTGIYSEAVIGTGNIYEIGYTPTPGVFSKGAGVFIDTNENVGIGAQPPTTMPLYATGASLFVQGLQSNQGNFMRVDNVATTGSLGLTNYFVTIDATAGNVTLTLPAASTAFGNSMGIKYIVQRIDNSGNTITIQRAGSDTINGGTSFTLGTQWESKNIQCTSTSTWAQH